MAFGVGQVLGWLVGTAVLVAVLSLATAVALQVATQLFTALEKYTPTYKHAYKLSLIGGEIGALLCLVLLLVVAMMERQLNMAGRLSLLAIPILTNAVVFSIGLRMGVLTGAWVSLLQACVMAMPVGALLWFFRFITE